MDAPLEPTPTPEIRRGALATVWLTLFLDLVAFGIIIPVLPYYAESFGASAKVVTLLSTTYSLAQFAFAPVLGRLSDRHGRRPVMLISIAGSIAAMLSLAAAHTLFFVFLARAIGGMSNANISTAYAYVADQVPGNQRAKYMGIMGSAIGFGFVVGPAIGGVLSRPDLPELPFLVGAVLSAINWLMALILLPETRSPEQRAASETQKRPRLLAAIRGALWGTPLGWLVATYFGFFSVFAAMESTFALFCEAVFDWTSRETGYLFSLIGVVILLTQGVLVGRVVAWLGEQRTMVAGLAILAVGLVATAFAPNVPVLALGAAGIAMGNGLVTPSISALVSQTASAEEQGWAQGLTQSSAAFARILAPIGAGLVFEWIGPGVPMATGAVVLLLIVGPIAAAKVRAPVE